MGYIFTAVLSACIVQVFCRHFMLNEYEKVNFSYQNESFRCLENECSDGHISFNGENNTGLHVTFHAFDRAFNIIAARGFSSLPGTLNNVGVVFVASNSTFESLPIEGDFLLGRLKGRPECNIEGYLDNNFPRLTIICPEDIYNLEPSGSFKKSGERFNAIVTRASDIFYSPCAGTNCSTLSTKRWQNDADFSTPKAAEQLDDEISKFHLSRSCDLHVIADHTFKLFHDSLGNGIANDIKSTVRLVDFWFRKTDFNGDGTQDSFGLSISKLSILDERYSEYLLQPENLTAEEILDKLSEMAVEPNIGEHCLVILFTHRDLNPLYFQGLAMQSGSNPSSAGGVCAKTTTIKGKGKRRPNVAFVTNINYRKILPRLVLAVNFAHVIGHSLGSVHDDDTHFYGEKGVCSSINRKRWYIMSAVAFKPVAKNNYEFSRCSLRLMLPVMRNKGWCFRMITKTKEPQCGDGEVQPGEECDCGFADQCAVIDPCCTPAMHRVGAPCQISRELGSECSSRMSQCCDETCKVVKDPDVKCNIYFSECHRDAYCDGNSSDCPAALTRPDFTSCERHTRMCYGGECELSPCMSKDKEISECLCGGSNECKVCCRTQDKCKPARQLGIYAARGREYVRQEGTPCAYGKGTCDSLGTCRLHNLDLSMDTVHAPVERLRESDITGRMLLVCLVVFLCIIAIVIVVATNWYLCYVVKRRSRQLSHYYKLVGQERQDIIASETEELRLQVARLSVLFPGASTAETVAVAREQDAEEAMVGILLERGYPIRKDFVAPLATLPPQVL